MKPEEIIEQQKTEIANMQKVLVKIYRIATGEDQVAEDDTEGMTIIARLAQGQAADAAGVTE